MKYVRVVSRFAHREEFSPATLSRLEPQPTATPTSTPTPGASLQLADTPPLSGWRVKIQVDQGYRKVLDSRALVGPDTAYCSAIGYGGDTCVARNEEDPQAVTCQNKVVGLAKDTNRYGPTWYFVPKGSSTPQPCRPSTDTTQDPGCKNHDSNQYFVLAFGPGVYSPCGENGVCGGFEIP
jgi:hypothetical protein